MLITGQDCIRSTATVWSGVHCIMSYIFWIVNMAAPLPTPTYIQPLLELSWVLFQGPLPDRVYFILRFQCYPNWDFIHRLCMWCWSSFCAVRPVLLRQDCSRPLKACCGSQVKPTLHQIGLEAKSSCCAPQIFLNHISCLWKGPSNIHMDGRTQGLWASHLAITHSLQHLALSYFIFSKLIPFQDKLLMCRLIYPSCHDKDIISVTRVTCQGHIMPDQQSTEISIVQIFAIAGQIIIPTSPFELICSLIFSG